MPRIKAGNLKKFTSDVFVAAGAPPSEAETVADCLVEANLAGHDSHGVLRIPSYLKEIRRGNLVPGAGVKVYNETDSSAKMDGNRGFGQVVMSEGMNRAIEKSIQNPIGIVTITNCGHTGRLAYYSAMSANRGRIGIVLLGGRRGKVAPYGGSDGRIYVNALAISVPTPGEEFAELDMSVSSTGWGKIMVQRSKQEACPEGWLLDEQGRPTTDPFTDLSANKGAIQPLGGSLSGHKGSGLALMLGILCGLAERGDHPGSGGVGHILISINVDFFLPLEAFQDQLDDFIRHVKQSRPADGFSEVLVPGERSRRIREIRLKEGIPLELSTWEELCDLADKQGVSNPDPT